MAVWLALAPSRAHRRAALAAVLLPVLALALLPRAARALPMAPAETVPLCADRQLALAGGRCALSADCSGVSCDGPGLTISVYLEMCARRFKIEVEYCLRDPEGGSDSDGSDGRDGSGGRLSTTQYVPVGVNAIGLAYGLGTLELVDVRDHLMWADVEMQLETRNGTVLRFPATTLGEKEIFVTLRCVTWKVLTIALIAVGMAALGGAMCCWIAASNLALLYIAYMSVLATVGTLGTLSYIKLSSLAVGSDG